MTEVSTRDVERIIDRMDLDNATLRDTLCPLDKSKIYRHKSHTTNFCNEYYPEHVMKKGKKVKASPTDWNMRRYRLRMDLKQYLETDIDYKNISSPLKAYINWCVKERANIKNTCMESKYNPDEVKQILKHNKALAIARDKAELNSIRAQNRMDDLEGKVKKNVKHMECQTESTSVDVGCQTDMVDDESKICYAMIEEYGEEWAEKYTKIGRDGNRRIKYFFEMDYF